ncbi:MAG: efflux RND transporter periplasmic adaptor subunit [Opitutae bacterium]|nr:efflux RND transporter periplasmic adaptor subunit [Opitutae bacterium]
MALFATAALLVFSGCTDSHASAGNARTSDPAPAATYKAGRGLRLSEPALAFAGVATAEFTGRLPAAALLRTARGDFVYVANDGWLLRTPVNVDGGDGLSFAASDGLYEGDVVVVSGALALWLAEIQAVNGGVGCADGH